MKIGLFIPCYIDAIYPEVGVATLELLEKLGLDVGYILPNRHVAASLCPMKATLKVRKEPKNYSCAILAITIT